MLYPPFFVIILVQDELHISEVGKCACCYILGPQLSPPENIRTARLLVLQFSASINKAIHSMSGELSRPS